MKESEESAQSISSTEDSTIDIMSSGDEQIDITSDLDPPGSSKNYVLESDVHNSETAQEYL